MQPRPPLRPLAAARPSSLRGSFRAQGDATISHLALLLASVARGETVIGGLAETLETLATVRALRSLGVGIDKGPDGWHVSGLGANGLLAPGRDLDFADDFVGAALTLGLVAAYDFRTRIVGSDLLAEGDFAPVLAPLASLGTRIHEGRDGRLPIAVEGPRLPLPIQHRFATPSPLGKAAALLAALAVPGTSRIVEPWPTADHVEKLLRAFGARLEVMPGTDGAVAVSVDGLANLRARDLAIPADPYGAGFAMVAAAIVPQSEIVVEGLLLHPARSALLQTLIEMGADIGMVAAGKSGGEDVADVRVRWSPLRGVTLGPERLLALGEDFPAFAVAAAAAEEQTTIEGISYLPPRAATQLAAVTTGLVANGVTALRMGDVLRIGGIGQVRGGGRVRVEGDASVAMAFLVLGLGAHESVTVDDQAPLAAKFPDFVPRFEAIGASFLRFAE